MPGLIPLMLNPVAAGNRSSVVFAPASAAKRHSRGHSLNSVPLANQSLQYPPLSPSNSPPHSQRASLPAPPRAKPVKRLSFAVPASLPVLPYTVADWRRTIAEVKRQHINRRFRACFTRCNEILDNIKDASDIEPAYLISLHFYAATSLEMCARPLIASSAYRDSLFQQARVHYDQAAVLIQNAEETAHPRTRARFSLLSSSSLPSPSGSVSSRTWTSETELSSPTPSICSSEDLNACLRQSQSPSSSPSSSPRPARKKVSFELPKEALPRWEPYIRPDSPTLGFDDEYFTTALSRQNLPEVPSRAKPLDVVPATEQAKDEQAKDEQATPTALKCSSFDSCTLGAESDAIRRSFLASNSVTRYCSHLAGLKTQLARHRASLDALLELSACNVGDGRRVSISVSDETQAFEKKARIERLRKSGWQRRRFDPSRYEALRVAALSELD